MDDRTILGAIELTCAECGMKLVPHIEDGALVVQSGKVAYREIESGHSNVGPWQPIWLCDTHESLIGYEYTVRYVPKPGR